MRTIGFSISLFGSILFFVAIGWPRISITLFVMLLASLVLEMLSIRFPYTGSLSFGILVYLAALNLLGAPEALACCLVSVFCREVFCYSSVDRFLSDFSIETSPVLATCLLSQVEVPHEDWVLWIAQALTWEMSRRLVTSFFTNQEGATGKALVHRVLDATADLRWGLLGLACLSTPISTLSPGLSLLFLPAILSLRRSAIHAYAYLDQSDKLKLRSYAGLLSKDLEAAREQIGKLHNRLHTTVAEKDLLATLSKESSTANSLGLYFLAVRIKAKELGFGEEVRLSLAGPKTWLTVECDGSERPVRTERKLSILGKGIQTAWKSHRMVVGERLVHAPLPGVGVLSLKNSSLDEHQKDLLSVFGSQVALGCLSAKRYETIEHALKRVEDLNKNLEETLVKLKASEAQLVQSEKLAAIGQLSAGLAHEINNPLSTVKLAVEMVQRNPDLPTTHKKLLDDAVIGLDRTKTILSSLLTYSRAGDKGQQKADLNELVRDAVSFLAGTFRLEGVKLETKLLSKPVPLKVNIQDIQQILTNLLLNAKDASVDNSNPSVLVSVVSQPVPAVEVHDNGNGVDPELQDTIFEPFVTSKSMGDGAGLGLSVSLELAGRQKAELSYERSGKLGGACFLLRFRS